ncbi:hypothetical protein [Treponema sp.]|uniref:hypothetical protein n=1 Tax=Treponema sp. TaxID=166 RepID=UPI0025E8D352|nr:hypothetical protein [Treponema sp.]MCR5219235.1 hypothetical protein [Treponema sp.]
MVQFYLLSVVFNIIAALVLVYGKNFADSAVKKADEVPDDSIIDEEDSDVFDLSDSEKKENTMIPGLDNGTFRLVLGILCAFVGLIKLVSAYRGIPVLGDLLPSIAGILAGGSMLVEYYYISCIEPELIPDSVRAVFIDSRRYIGIACFVIALLHFIMPSALIF